MWFYIPVLNCIFRNDMLSCQKLTWFFPIKSCVDFIEPEYSFPLSNSSSSHTGFIFSFDGHFEIISLVLTLSWITQTYFLFTIYLIPFYVTKYRYNSWVKSLPDNFLSRSFQVWCPWKSFLLENITISYVQYIFIIIYQTLLLLLCGDSKFYSSEECFYECVSLLTGFGRKLTCLDSLSGGSSNFSPFF